MTKERATVKKEGVHLCEQGILKHTLCLGRELYQVELENKVHFQETLSRQNLLRQSWRARMDWYDWEEEDNANDLEALFEIEKSMWQICASVQLTQFNFLL